MSKDRDRTVYQRDDKSWVNKRNDSERASSVHTKQSDALRSARNMLHSQGGGELTTIGRDHKIRDKDTIVPGKDPFPPRG